MLYVAFLWHMHQPWYLDPEKGEFLLPWVRLHGTKDYLDAAAFLKEFPAVRAVINIAPSLLEQIELYGRGIRDRHQILSGKPAEGLTAEEAAELLECGFWGNPERLIHPFPRYYALMAKRRRKQSFSAAELRDLQVWSNLSWMDPRWRREIPLVARLVLKGASFTEQEKEELLRVQADLLGRIIPAYRALQESGQAEISASPWAHPILPLLNDSQVAAQTNPGMPLPAERFQHPEDALWHLTEAVRKYAGWFGRAPQGLWPSEGALSRPVLDIIARAGFRWVATDEELLWKTLASSGRGAASRNDLYRPYRVSLEEGNLAVLFRDHLLSDLIGFVYSNWPPLKAAADFMDRLRAVERSLPPDLPALLLVALDGENPWEFYPEDGEPFLRALYQALSEERSIRCVTISEFLERHPPQAQLPGLSPGSWIRGELSTWIGHEPQNRAWEELARARRLIGPAQSQALAIAEGSDWFWWLGPEHSSPNDPVFDRLFRSFLKRAHREAGKAPPDSLDEPLKPKAAEGIPPVGFMTPCLDGEVTSYFEWLRAGGVELTHTASAMARAKPVFSKLWWGCDADLLYLRLDPVGRLQEAALKLTLEGPHFQVNLELDSGMVRECPEGVKAVIGRVLEIALPRERVSRLGEETVKMAIVVQQEGMILERYPEHGFLLLAPSHPKAAGELWSA